MNDTKHILIVDDDQDIRTLLQDFLSQYDYQVSIASNGVEMFKVLNKTSVDLIILDVMMPDLSGFDVCKRLRADKKTQFLPVIIVTSLHEIEDKIAALESGADDFITKPPNEIELAARIRSLLRIKKQRDEIEAIKRDFTAMLVHDLPGPEWSV